MENIKISLSESGKDEQTSIVRVDGVIDTLTATELEEVLEKLLKRGRHKLVLDLAGVDYISSAGWGIFISRIKEIRENEGDIKLANMVPNVREIYELLEFDNILSAYDNVGSAKNAFGNSSAEDDSKKKARMTSARTTIEELPFASNTESAEAAQSQYQSDTHAPSGVTEAVLAAIRRDPFYTISELKLVLEESLMDARPSWWQIFRILWKNNLLSRRSRFRYARQYNRQR